MDIERKVDWYLTDICNTMDTYGPWITIRMGYSSHLLTPQDLHAIWPHLKSLDPKPQIQVIQKKPDCVPVVHFFKVR